MSRFSPEDVALILQRFSEIPNVAPPPVKQGVYHKVVDYEEMFRQLPFKPVILNEFDTSKEEERQRLNDIIYTEYDGETLSNVPRCECESDGLSGEVNVGILCDTCGTEVRPVTEKALQSLLWMTAPHPVPAFINLTVWRIMERYMRLQGFSVIQYLTDPYYVYKTKRERPVIRKLRALNLPLGLTNFYNHFDDIIEKLHQNGLLAAERRNRDLIYKFLKENRSRVFSKVLPCPSRLLFITERNNDQIWIDDNLKGAIHAINTLTSIYATNRPLDRKTVESRVVKVMRLQDEFYRTYEKNICFKKQGIIRKLILGSRPNHTFRAVISSEHEPHDVGTVKLPWSLSVLLLATHLRSKMLRMDLTPPQMSALIFENTLKSHPLIKKIIQELQDEAPGGAMEALLVRFPLLRRASTTNFRLGIKDDASDNTISYPVLACVGPNADPLWRLQQESVLVAAA